MTPLDANLLNATHDPKLQSWVASANTAETDFPIQNLPFGRFRRINTTEPWRIGVAIGDHILDLRLAADAGQWSAEAQVMLASLDTRYADCWAGLKDGFSVTAPA